MRWQILLTLGLESVLGFYFRQPVVFFLFLLLNTLVLAWRFERYRRLQAKEPEHRNEDLSVKIAHETLPYLRRGLDESNAEAIAQIIQSISQVAAVAITDRERVLSYLGVGCDQHHPGDRILTEATKEVIRTGNYKVVRTQKQLNCARKDICNCPLAAAVIVPLRNRSEVVGTVKLYETKDGQLSPDVIRLALGMAQLLGMQIELAELDHQAKLTAEAQLDALHAQINPHFFFNVLNTIIATSRSNPNRTRRLLIHLAEFFRRALKSKGTVIPLREEMEFVNTYLILEKARFGRKLQVKEEIPEELWDIVIPRLSIQPLVENAVKHGITPKMGNGTVLIHVECQEDEVLIRVKDDGVGIPLDRIRNVLLPGFGSGNGVGMANVHERLKGLYGESYGLKVVSEPGAGTTVSMRLPLAKKAENKVQDFLPRPEV
ncbi:Two component system, signal transduction histidine kinase [Acididesulfobacillus acetoxydans]|uniref:histidine kinase n=1 Tax=Acididesulfobacillus acetoxydans TaxID=1561005 RepID=A0A8S0VWB6_9FIRM|nr:histidine kinase [Acididesulfobacillus acetoxydans]CAA7600683.1 Two component system, signal transduction histidine kinase [Acididesulfobacillus acetoxydans]CEJ09464.1 Sensor protein LytS [Acididesulfobacillus acetoxydans]